MKGIKFIEVKWWADIKRSDWLVVVIYYVAALMITIPVDIAQVKSEGSHAQFISIFLIRFKDYLIDIAISLVCVFGIFNTFFERKRYFLIILLGLLLLTFQALIQPLLLPNYYPSFRPFYMEHLLSQIANNVEAISGVSLLLIAKQFYESKKQIETLQVEKKTFELKWLRNQIDPHFLFNNLNILDILIKNDKDRARLYTQKLSSLYRYMIRHKDQDVVSLKEELIFCQNYIYLLEQRFDKLFEFEVIINPAFTEQFLIPPAAVQTLLENIIKHNTALPEKPIRVSIFQENGYLVVKNNLNKKENLSSTGTGLTNLSKRVELISKRSVQIINNDQNFIAKIPLVKLVE